MKHLLTVLAALCILAAPAAAQTIKSLGYNSTNGQIVAATNAVWTNAFNFSTNTVAAQVRTNLGLGASWITNTNVTNFRTNIGLGWSALTNTNAANFRNVIGLGTDMFVSFAEISASTTLEAGSSSNTVIIDGDGISFGHSGMASTTRTNLGLSLAALTNTSNVTAMRALGGSTNTNEPYSGTVALTNTNVLTFSNGVLLKIE